MILDFPPKIYKNLASTSPNKGPSRGFHVDSKQPITTTHNKGSQSTTTSHITFLNSSSNLTIKQTENKAATMNFFTPSTSSNTPTRLKNPIESLKCQMET